MEFFATSGVAFEIQLWHLKKKKEYNVTTCLS